MKETWNSFKILWANALNIIQDNDHLHYRFFNSAYIFNGQETEILFFEHPSAQLFKIQDNNIIRVKTKDRYQEFIVNEWRWAGFD